MTNTVRIVPRSVNSVPAQDSASVNAAPGAVICHRCYSRAQLINTSHTNMTGNNLLLLKETVARDRLFQFPPINMTLIAIVRRQHAVDGGEREGAQRCQTDGIHCLLVSKGFGIPAAI